MIHVFNLVSGLLIIGLIGLLYMLAALAAHHRGHRQTKAIAVLNILLGCSSAGSWHWYGQRWTSDTASFPPAENQSGTCGRSQLRGARRRSTVRWIHPH